MSSTVPSDDHVPVPDANWRGPLRLGFALVVVLFGGFGGWSAFATLASATIAPGVVAVESNRRTVQHLEGGIVSEILVRDGTAVAPGEVLVRLESVRAEISGDLYRNQIAGLLAQDAKLTAQRDGAERITFPEEVQRRAADPLVRAAIADQTRQFDARRETLHRMVEVFTAQMQQTERIIQQSEVDQSTLKVQVENITRELASLQDLYRRGLVPTTRVNPLEREQTRLRGAIDRARLEGERGRAQLSELRLRSGQLHDEYRQEAATQLPDVRRAIGDARQNLKISEDQLKRIDVKAPVAGVVQQLRIFTVGGVVRPGEPILDIVPSTDNFIVRAKVSPIDADRVRTGMEAEVRFPQFQKFSAALIRGVVRSLSTDRILDELSRDYYFSMEVSIDKASVPLELVDKVTAGMTVETVVPTDGRTALQYLVSPLINRASVSMRER